MKHILKMFASLFLWVCLSAQAFSPEWITHETRGRVKYSEASKIVSLVHRFAFEYGVDPALVFRIIRVESNYNRRAISHCNARGLMQVVPRWHREKIQNRDLYDPSVAVEVGVRVISEYIEKYGSEELALRAYYGDHRSGAYPKKIYAVNLNALTSAYPGSDDRPYDYLTPEGEFVGPLESHTFFAFGQEFTVTHHPQEDATSPMKGNDEDSTESSAPTVPEPEFGMGHDGSGDPSDQSKAHAVPSAPYRQGRQ